MNATKIETFRTGFRLYRQAADGRWINQGYYKTLEAAQAASK